jgi:hypothetical protein
MLIDTLTARLRLCRREPAHLDDARDSVLTCVEGDLWITVDGDRRDIVLSPGESFVVESDEHVLVFPLLGAATLDVRGRSARSG